jgi:hypothetical protein
MDSLFQYFGKTKKVGRPKGSKNNKKTKKPKSKTDIQSKKGGNFLGSIEELVAPTGWGGFASAAALLAIDRADSALRRFNKDNKKMSGGRHGTTRKKIFNQRMDVLKIKYNESDGKWKRKGEVVIDCSKYGNPYLSNLNGKRHELLENDFPSLPIVIDSLSNFFKIPIKYKNGKLFAGNLELLFYTGKEILKDIYDKMYEDVCEKLRIEHNL